LRQRCNIYTLILEQAHVSIQAKAGITKEVGEHMTEHSKVLSKGRKKRVMPEGLATVDEIEKLGLLSSHPLHKSTKVGFSGSVPCLIMCFVPDEHGPWKLLHVFHQHSS
jgi:hypothetical protein